MIKKSILILSAVILSINVLFCQDTLYLNKNWVKTAKDSASYYSVFRDTSNFVIVKDYDISGTLQMVGYSTTRDPLVKFGIFHSYYENGAVSSVENFKENLLEGKSVYYYENGKVSYEREFQSDRKIGELKGYYENGTLRRIDHYKNDSLLDGKCYAQMGGDTAYFAYEQNARFKYGDIQTFRKYVMRKVSYPGQALRKGIQGRVILQFVVNSKGKVVDIKVLKSPSDLLSKAAIEALSQSDTWEPGIQEGKKVKQQFVIPINFQLD